ncbi:hypothetical protein RR48_10805 [Papilio machaon]|uniref:Peptidase S1 domain-containing protein n=1 Tax=Papilio machaon TaxID=76193 RepID=A0A194RCI8_PAPMA|nr:hypothetical protein RR48_10805 [Papilio machaon]
MEEIVDDNNKLIEENIDTDLTEFSYNFIDIPWDDRTQRSKILVVLLLLSIFIATMALVVNNFVAHYNSFRHNDSYKNDDINCNLVKVDEYPYAARIQSLTSQQLICVGAVISENSVLANEVCLKSGTVRLFVGSITDQYCKKGFSLDAAELIPHDGVVSKNLVLLSTNKKMSLCGNPIRIAGNMEKDSHAFVIGRPLRGDRSLSRQLVSLDVPDNYTHNGQLIDNSRRNNVICVKYLSRCPVRAGDLLVQGGRLYGIASTSIQRSANNEVVCFANVSIIKTKLKELDDSLNLNL